MDALAVGIDLLSCTSVVLELSWVLSALHQSSHDVRITPYALSLVPYGV